MPTSNNEYARRMPTDQMESNSDMGRLHAWLDAPPLSLANDMCAGLPYPAAPIAPKRLATWAWWLSLAGAVPLVAAFVMTGIFFFAYKHAAPWMYDNFDQSPIRFVEPIMVLEHIRTGRYSPQFDEESQMPLGREPASLFELIRVEEYMDMTGNSDPYQTFPHPMTPVEKAARKAQFDRFQEFAAGDASGAFGKRVDMRCASLDFRWYWLGFAFMGTITGTVFRRRNPQ